MLYDKHKLLSIQFSRCTAKAQQQEKKHKHETEIIDRQMAY